MRVNNRTKNTRKLQEILYKFFAYLSMFIATAVLVGIVFFICIKGVPHLKPSLFAVNYTSKNVSMFPAIISTIVVVVLSILIAGPIGIFTGIYLAEYSKGDSKFVKVIRIVTETLSAIPSIVYGLFGYLFFGIALKMGWSIISGTLTVSIMILPLIVRSTEEAFLSTPGVYRLGSFALGAGRLRTIFKVILPVAMPGILSGIILAIGRVIGETAALLYTLGTSTNIPKSLKDPGITLSLHMYKLSTEARYTNEAYATAVVLLVIIFLLNWISTSLANKIGGNNDDR